MIYSSNLNSLNLSDLKPPLKVVATAYTIDPYQGSEAGMGWNFALAISSYADLEIWTRKNNEANIQKFISENPSHLASSISFRYFDLPKNVRTIKKSLGVIGSQFYYLLWNLFVALRIQKERRKVDLYHCINFHTDWIPHFLYLCSPSRPIIWGPIGHHKITPLSYLIRYKYPIRYIPLEIMRSLIKNISWKMNPLLKKSIETSYILPMNSDSIRSNDLTNKKSLGWSIVKSVASSDDRVNFDKKLVQDDKIFSQLKVIFVGRFVPMKGLSIVIESFVKLINDQKFLREGLSAKLTCIGTGACEGHYRRQVLMNNALNDIHFVPWMPHEKLKAMLNDYDVLFFPSFEGAGMIVVEAMLAGCVCITLDNHGPGATIGNTGYKVSMSSNYTNITNQFCDIMLQLCTDKNLLEAKKMESKNYALANHLWSNRLNSLKEIYSKLSSQYR